jgi:methylamine dehydrogenase heavy chain
VSDRTPFNQTKEAESVKRYLPIGLAALFLSSQPVEAAEYEWDSVVGAVAEVGEPGPHWFTVRGRHIGYLIDGDSGEVQGSMTLSLFSPALRSQISKGRIYSYGSFYTRTYYGERTDVVLTFDAKTMAPIAEVEIPAKSAGIGHSGMIGLIDDRFIGVWNITPSMSVSIVDTRDNTFVGEIFTPGCAAVYPVGRGFLMPCGDGTLQYIALKGDGSEASRIRSGAFFEIDEDPVFDYAVPTASGWMFMSMDGLVFEAELDGDEIVVSEPWSILAGEEEGSEWRIGGRQPFAFNAEHNLLFTLMHESGGQETFEDPGTEIWAFSTETRNRGYRLALPEEELGSGVQVTPDAKPILIVAPDESNTLRIYDARTGHLLEEMAEMGGGLIQNLEG